MIEGLMQHDHPLTTRRLVERCETVNASASCITAAVEKPRLETSFGVVAGRAHRVAHALASLGVREGDRVATLMWNSQEHLELYLGVSSSGAVLHTLNLRLLPAQLAWIVNHAEDRVVFVDASLASLAAEIAPECPTVRHWVVVGGTPAEELPAPLDYEALLGEQPGEPYAWPDLDDRAAAALCYTSGTTGNPKGVLYSHRSTLLHTLQACMSDTFGVSCRDRILLVVPMFHANAWGLPYAAALVGATLVMPGRDLSGAHIAEVIASERATVATGVPTIWYDVLRHADRGASNLASLRAVITGGASPPRDLMQALQERHGVTMLQIWGMTETSPIGSVALPGPEVEGEEHWRLRQLAGKLAPLVDARIVGEDDRPLPWDGEVTGELEVRGPCIASAYLHQSGADRFHDGWLRTGDVAAISHDGWIRIADRAKDVIKSGGEWISSTDLENELIAHPRVRECAVIARPDERWTERPLACVVPEGDELAVDELADWLRGRVAKWWIPEQWVLLDALPLTGTGKLDKKELRRRLAEDELPSPLVSGR